MIERGANLLSIAMPVRPMAPGAAARAWSAIGAEWRLVLCYAAAAAAICALTGTQLSLGAAGRTLLALPLLTGIMTFYRYCRPAPLMTGAIDTLLKLLSILILGMLISFPAATLGGVFSYRDAWLMHADALLGFDRHAYVAFVAARAWLEVPMVVAYVSMLPQYFVVGLALFFTHQEARREAFVLLTGGTLAVTLAIFVFMPALTHPAGAWVAAIDYMRVPGTHAISFDDLAGIVTFPSFHTISACLFIWGCWRTKYLRWVMLALNLVLIAATPVCGQHYGADVVAAIAITIVAVWLVTRTKARPRDAAAAPELATDAA
jgi:hypothetical protein